MSFRTVKVPDTAANEGYFYMVLTKKDRVWYETPFQKWDQVLKHLEVLVEGGFATDCTQGNGNLYQVYARKDRNPETEEPVALVVVMNRSAWYRT